MVQQAPQDRAACENEDQCCLCLPIKCGLVTLGVFSFFHLAGFVMLVVVVNAMQQLIQDNNANNGSATDI